MARRKAQPIEHARKLRPPATQEEREAYLVSLAYDAVEERLLNGTASGQEITALLKLGSEKTKFEKEKLRHETEVLKSKKSVLDASKRTDEAYEKAMAVMKTYMGIEDVPDDPYIL